MDTKKPLDLDHAQRAHTRLIETAVRSESEFVAWLQERSRLDSDMHSHGLQLYLAFMCDTNDAEAARLFREHSASIVPVLKKMSAEVDLHELQLHEEFPLDEAEFGIYAKRLAVDRDLYCEANLALETEINRLVHEWTQLTGDRSPIFMGEPHTIQQLKKHLSSPDRSIREAAWRTNAAVEAEQQSIIDELFDQMVQLRHESALQAGKKDYREYRFHELCRFDYTPEDVESLHATCEQILLPVNAALSEDRKCTLGLDTLRPWDMAVDPHGHQPLAPYASVEELIEGCGTIFQHMDPELFAMYQRLCDGNSLDLDSRKGKATGGFQAMRIEPPNPFIFMNGTGQHHDVITLLHESGHAFHSLLCLHHALLLNRRAPMEFCEVASMTIELITMPYWSTFYPDPADQIRAKRQQLTKAMRSILNLVRLDSFQHWLYTHPQHTRAERQQHWLDLSQRLNPGIDISGLEAETGTYWQSIPHLFRSPFYMVEYIYAQLGALQIWRRVRREGLAEPLKDYKAALQLGGTQPRPVPGGSRFDGSIRPPALLNFSRKQ